MLVNNMSKHLTKGVSLVEAVVSVAIITGVVLALFTVFGKLLIISNNSLHTLQAASLLSEGAEVVRLWRDESWDNLAGLDVGEDYFYQFSANAWATSTVNQYVDGRFDRRFRLCNVGRDANSEDIVAGCGPDNPSTDTKLVTVEVAWWENAATTTKSVSFYLTKLF